MGSKWELSETLREELMAERSAALEALNPMYVSLQGSSLQSIMLGSGHWGLGSPWH